MTDVFMNDVYVGKVDDQKIFLDTVKSDRQKGKLPRTLNISYNDRLDEVNIELSSGRVRRPLIVVENGQPRLTEDHLKALEKGELSWNDLVNQGIIDYLDAAEEENAFVALNRSLVGPENTHMEISPSAIFGITTSLVPYANFGQSSRLNRGSKAQKQSLGFYAANYLLRMDTDVSVLQYPQQPLVRTFMHELFDANHPAGQNITVAMMSYEGYNMSDSIILNKGSVDRGLARSFYFRPYDAEELRYSGGLVDEVGIPDKEVKGYRSEKDYKNLEEDGIISPEVYVKEDDVMIGKTSPPRFLGEMEEFSIAANIRRESSVAVKHGEHGTTDLVIVTENEEGNKLVKIRLRELRVPELGDKFASRHGQKGVIGLIVPQADLPFSANGIVPDLIFSPHSIPSRMTVSHLIELVGGKVAALSGKYTDGTTFLADPEKEIRNHLFELGFRENGTEVFYNGITGERFTAKIYVGSMFYLKLRHMAANKLHARASGRIQLLTRQPIEGRSKGGGLRFGEMEKDCVVAHGASLLLKERFDSDKTLIHICEECGMWAVHDTFRKRKFCARCGNNVEITAIEMSYAFKLLIDELKALGLLPRLRLKSKY
ncbi:MAG: DNA-directed RNA polymerase subunit B [Candidatus Nanoarchaeia archaeon]|nr:DNA-directed RNA polymerase subunit B [Candidatus Nanoarchaeia archaeon]